MVVFLANLRQFWHVKRDTSSTANVASRSVMQRSGVPS